MAQSNRAGRCAARSIWVSGNVRKKITSIVGRKRNLTGEFIGFFFFLIELHPKDLPFSKYNAKLMSKEMIKLNNFLAYLGLEERK